jgi:hypothetical protein
MDFVASTEQMEKRIRELLFEPLRQNVLSAIVPDFVFRSGNQEIATPAQLVRHNHDFKFTLHFNTGTPPPELQSVRGGFFNEADKKTVTGRINGEISFWCDDIFPPSTMTTRSRGTSIVVLNSHRLHLAAESTDQMTTSEVKKLIGQETNDEHAKTTAFDAHLIYHGPKLKMFGARTETTTKNDFLGDAASSSADTHQFEAETWEGALIQQGLELHLHLRSRKEADVDLSEEELTDIIDCANQAVGFVLGFNPWPAYREVRIDHKVVERWLSPTFDLPTTYLTPVSESMWTHFLKDKGNLFHRIVSTIADGLGRISKGDRKKLTTLLWHFRSGTSRNLPSSTRLLILCAVIDGLMKLIAGARDPKNAATDKTWRKASDSLGFSWDKWTKDVFEVWGKHRHLLGHGWLWLTEELDPHEFFTDHARLGCAFITFVAAYCGYEGPIMADPFKNRIIRIRDIKT